MDAAAVGAAAVGAAAVSVDAGVSAVRTHYGDPEFDNVIRINDFSRHMS